jgi:hypothetical protein
VGSSHSFKIPCPGALSLYCPSTQLLSSPWVLHRQGWGRVERPLLGQVILAFQK